MILNKTRSHRERYRILPGNMGNYKEPLTSPNHKYHVVNGVGPNYCGSMSMDYFFKQEYVPDEAKKNAIKFLSAHGYDNWLKEQGLNQ
jgi:hypothetical protein